MGEFLSYSILSGLVLLAMYLVYRILLANDNQHSFNRGVLLLIYFISFLTVPAMLTVHNLSGHSPSDGPTLENIEGMGAAMTPLHRPIWGTVLIWIFIIGMIAVAARTVATWLRLTSVIRSGEKIRRDGCTLVVTDNERFAPFSWMRFIVISRTDYTDNLPAIATHELKHVEARHWIDLLIAQLVCSINWFNPAAWLMRDELMLVHEYQADMAVIDGGHDTRAYQMLLIKKAVGARFPSLANSLNHSKLKKRITMMYKERSSAGHRFKALALVPMLALALGAASVPAVRAAVTTICSSEISVGKDSENRPQTQVSVQFFKVTNVNNDGNATTVVIHGENLGDNLSVTGGTFTNDGTRYDAATLKCDMTNGTATIVATFPFSAEYKNPEMTFIINGKEVPFDLDDFFNNSQSVRVGGSGDSAASPKAIVIGAPSSSIPEGMVIYVDGKKVIQEELHEIDPGKIASVTVDKQKNMITITLKK